MNEEPNKKAKLKAAGKDDKPMIMTVKPAAGVNYNDLPNEIVITTCVPGEAKAGKDAK